MQNPKIPSFFKTQNIKKFNFIPRYYNSKKEQVKNVSKNKANSIIFNKKKKDDLSQKQRTYKIIFLIIILSLLAYKLLTN